MKRVATIISMVVLAGSLAGSAIAADGVLLKQQTDNNYCYMKFPAIKRRTLSTDQPTLKSTQTGDVIDYNGPCNESATGADQVLQQKHEESFMFGRDYEDGD